MSHIDDMYFNSTGFEHYYQNRRRTKVLDALKRIGGKTMLDAGCAEGYFMECAFGMGYEAKGIDIKPNLHPWAIQGTIEGLPFDNDTFDVVLCSRVLEYVDYESLAISELFRVSKGWVIISVPLGEKPYQHAHGFTAYPFTVERLRKRLSMASEIDIRVLCGASKFVGVPIPAIDDVCEPWLHYGTDILAVCRK